MFSWFLRYKHHFIPLPSNPTEAALLLRTASVFWLNLIVFVSVRLLFCRFRDQVLDLLEDRPERFGDIFSAVLNREGLRFFTHIKG